MNFRNYSDSTLSLNQSEYNELLSDLNDHELAVKSIKYQISNLTKRCNEIRYVLDHKDKLMPLESEWIKCSISNPGVWTSDMYVYLPRIEYKENQIGISGNLMITRNNYEGIETNIINLEDPFIKLDDEVNYFDGYRSTNMSIIEFTDINELLDINYKTIVDEVNFDPGEFIQMNGCKSTHEFLSKVTNIYDAFSGFILDKFENECNTELFLTDAEIEEYFVDFYNNLGMLSDYVDRWTENLDIEIIRNQIYKLISENAKDARDLYETEKMLNEYMNSQY